MSIVRFLAREGAGLLGVRRASLLTPQQGGFTDAESTRQLLDPLHPEIPPFFFESVDLGVRYTARLPEFLLREVPASAPFEGIFTEHIHDTLRLVTRLFRFCRTAAASRHRLVPSFLPASILRRMVAAVRVLLLTLTLVQLSIAEPRDFQLAPGPAQETLNEFGRQADVQLLFDFTQAKGLRTNGVTGRLEPMEALRRLLRGVPLEWYWANDRTLAITRDPSGVSHPPPEHQASPDSTPREQVIVVAANERDLRPPVGQLTLRLTRTDIEQSGYTTTQDFLHTLPQVFGGGPTEDTQLGREAASNLSKGSGVNLRGLDAGATLILIDGRRIASSGTLGAFSDVANIPLSAIDHIDVVPDGSSAEYGGDAIGGVVNIVLRDGFLGAETQATTGSLPDRLVSQLLGRRWDRGQGMLGFEYADQSALPARDRLQANDPGPGGDAPGADAPVAVALPSQRHWSLFGSTQGRLGPGVDLFGDALISHREEASPATTDRVTLGTLTSGLEVAAPRGWKVNAAVTYSWESERDPDSLLALDSRDVMLDLVANGALMRVPGGAVRWTVGAGFRDERFATSALAGGGSARLRRYVGSEFSELTLPLVGPANSRSGLQQLELSLAGRYDTYSDVGGAPIPKMGLAWMPLTSLVVRASLSESFKPPNLADRAATPSQLRPEHARSWQLGAELAPLDRPDLSLAANFFHGTFADRIAAVSAGTGDLLRNGQTLTTGGIDLIGKYTTHWRDGTLVLGLNGTYVLRYAEARSPGSPAMSLLNTQNNPLNLRVRGSVSWEKRGFSASGSLSYSSSYRDILSDPPRAIGSWTTADVRLAYDGLLHGVQISLSAQNLFNHYPPFLNNPVGVGYDQENADITGRIVNASIRWRR
jgi:iron complex outermembrane recepter protein